MSSIDIKKATPLSFSALQNMVGPINTKHCRWIVYDDLQKFEDIEELMSLGAVIILLEIESPRSPPVGHFVCLLDHGNHYEHFDSYGLDIDEELKLSQEKHLTNIFRNSPKKIISNTKRLQTFRDDVQTCGRWVVVRYLLKHLELDEFLGIFYHLKPQTPDEMVVIFSYLLPLKQ